MTPTGVAVLGLRTVVYRVSDLDSAKAWYARAFGVDPYFDQPFYVGFSIGGFELGLDPDLSAGAPGAGGSTSYWGVANADDAMAHFVAAGAAVQAPVTEVGDGIRVCSVLDPFGNVIGLIENPHFGKTPAP